MKRLLKVFKEKKNMKQETEEKIQIKHILVFTLMNEQFGLDISCVREVLKPLEIHHLPQVPDFIEGVINLRGKMFAIMDLRKKFRINIIENTPKKRIILCKVNKFIIGLIVDSVMEVLSLSEEDIQPTPNAISIQVENNYITGIARINERVITIFNLEEILSKKEMDILEQVKKKD